MVRLLGFGQADVRQRAHSGVDPVHRTAGAQHRTRLLAPGLDPRQQASPEPDPAPGGDFPDQARIQVSGAADRPDPGHDY